MSTHPYYVEDTKEKKNLRVPPSSPPQHSIGASASRRRLTLAGAPSFRRTPQETVKNGGT